MLSGEEHWESKFKQTSYVDDQWDIGTGDCAWDGGRDLNAPQQMISISPRDRIMAGVGKGWWLGDRASKTACRHYSAGKK